MQIEGKRRVNYVRPTPEFLEINDQVMRDFERHILVRNVDHRMQTLCIPMDKPIALYVITARLQQAKKISPQT